MILLVVPDQEENTESITQSLLTETAYNPTDLQPATSENPAQVSLHALMGHSLPQTLRALGQIKQHPIFVLTYSGNTHNFVQDHVAKQLGLSLELAHSFRVLVANGEQLPWCSFYPQISLQLDSHNFLVDLFVLPLSGGELVLGVQWLKKLGLILSDFEQLTMRFVN